MKKLFASIAILAVSGCMTKEYTPQTAASLRNGVGFGSLCAAIEETRYLGKQESLNALIAEYERRNPKVAKRWIRNLRAGEVATGMPEGVAACSWNAEIVSESIGYGQHSKQYRGGSSYFFVNGRTGRVDYIST